MWTEWICHMFNINVLSYSTKTLEIIILQIIKNYINIKAVKYKKRTYKSSYIFNILLFFPNK